MAGRTQDEGCHVPAAARMGPGKRRGAGAAGGLPGAALPAVPPALLILLMLTMPTLARASFAFMLYYHLVVLALLYLMAAWAVPCVCLVVCLAALCDQLWLAVWNLAWRQGAHGAVMFFAMLMYYCHGGMLRVVVSGLP